MQCNDPECHDEATFYWAAIYGGNDWTDYSYGYTCFGHEPSWEDIESELTDGKVIQFRVTDMETDEHVDEYNPLNYGWNEGTQ